MRMPHKMQIQYKKNLNPGRFELGTTLRWLKRSIKVKLVDKMMQSNYLCVILHVKSKKLLILTDFT